MKKSMKFVSALLIGTMALSMTACTKKSTETSSAASASSSVETVSASSEDVASVSEEVLADSFETVAVSADSEAVESTSEDFSIGDSEGTEYVNDTLNLKFTLPEGWSFFSEEQMKQLNAMVGDSFDNEQVADAIKSGKAFIDMYAGASDQMHNVNIVLTDAKINVEEAGGLDVVMSDAVIAQTKSSLEGQGMTNVNIERSTASFLGKEDTPVFKITAEMNGVQVNETMAFAINGRYLASITATAINDDTTQDILNAFSTAD
jgi:hypothetical protein